jgi:hypothetical protein
MKKLGVLFFSVLFILVLMLSFTGCGAGGESGAVIMDLAKEAGPSGRASAPPPPSEPAATGDTASGETAFGERKMISTGSLELEVEDLDRAEQSIGDALSETGGYLQSVNRYGDSFSMTLKIPAEEFSGFLDTAGGFGKLRSTNVTVEDVTDSYFDLEHRVRSKELLVERYQEYLKEAQSIEDLLKIERELNDTITELEQLEGSFRNLSHRISFSTLYLQAYLPSWESESDPLPSLRAGLKTFGRTLLRVLYAMFFIILGIVAFGVPLVLVIGLVYLAGFGRIGLIRRFFRRLRPRDGKKSAGRGEE